MGERLEWAPNGCDVGNRRGGEKVETMREVWQDCSEGAGYIFNRQTECDESWCKTGSCWWTESVSKWGWEGGARYCLRTSDKIHIYRIYVTYFFIQSETISPVWLKAQSVLVCSALVRYRVLTAENVKIIILLDYGTVQSRKSIPTFQRCILPTLSVISLIEAVRTSETSVYFNEITWCHIPEGCLLHFKAYLIILLEEII
jgi:hypothetical protein